MKKWHMESIISITETTAKKLAVPEAHQIPLWAHAYSFEPPEEAFIVTLCRGVVAFFVRCF